MNKIQDKIKVIKRHFDGLELAFLEEDKEDINSEWAMIQEKMEELRKLLGL